MSKPERAKYFDLHTTGIGYLNRVRQGALRTWVKVPPLYVTPAQASASRPF